jgi:hypothetical protein
MVHGNLARAPRLEHIMAEYITALTHSSKPQHSPIFSFREGLHLGVGRSLTLFWRNWPCVSNLGGSLGAESEGQVLVPTTVIPETCLLPTTISLQTWNAWYKEPLGQDELSCLFQVWEKAQALRSRWHADCDCPCAKSRKTQRTKHNLKKRTTNITDT